MTLTRMRLFGIILLFLAAIQNHVFAQDYHPDKYKAAGQTITSIRVASAAIVPEKWDKETNWSRIEKMVKEAAYEEDAKVVVTPEGILEGYVIEEANKIIDLSIKKKVIEKFYVIAEPINGTFIRKACALANELNIFFIFGFLESRHRKLFNTVILIDPDGDIIGKYSKTHFAEGYEIKPEDYTPGNDYPVFDTPFGKAGIIICYDRQPPEPARIMALKGAQILFVPAYGSYTGETGWNTVLMRTRAYENRFPLIFCNPFQSLIIDHGGNIRAIGKAGEITCFDVNTSPEISEGRFKNRRPGTYKEIYKLNPGLKQ